MKPFITKSYVEPNAIERMLKKVSDKNFLVDVNNLLADKPLSEISPNQIQLFAEKYKLKSVSQKYKNELIQMISDFLIEHLGNRGSDVNDFRSAQKLQNILGISDDDFDKEYKPLAIEIFKNQVTETLNKTKKYQDEEVAQFERLRKQLELPDDEAEQINSEIRNSIVRNYITSMISDSRVSPKEMETYEKLCKDLSVVVSIDDNSRKALEKFKRLWNIDNGILPAYEPDVILQKNELCHYKANAKLYENRKVTTGVRYGGHTFRLKIAKGWYYRVGDINTSRKSQDVMTLIDSGVLYITNKRILFNGSKANKTIRYNQIIDLTPYSDGVEIIKDSGKSLTFIMDYLDGESLTATIARIIRDSNGL